MASTYLRSIRRATVRTVASSATLVVLAEVTTHIPSQGRASETYHTFVDSVVTPLLRTYASPEMAHDLAVRFTQMGLAPIYRPTGAEQTSNRKLSTTVFGIQFDNPIGLAAGFDKNGSAIEGMQRLGFGFVEIGTVTPQPQEGNPKPRLFRLLQDRAIINRYGFNSGGMHAVELKLQEYRQRNHNLVSERTGDDPELNDGHSDEPLQSNLWSRTGASLSSLHKRFFSKYYTVPSTLVGINLGKNKETENEIDDYRQGIRQLGPYADYIVINVSSPNTPNLRRLQRPNALQALLQGCVKECDVLQRRIPLLVKLAPDLTTEELEEIADVVMTEKVDGIVVSNTTQDRPASLISMSHKDEPGGLSGLPLKDRSTECIYILYNKTAGKIPIIGVGGVSTAADVLQKLKAGASLVQIYSVLTYEGPGVVTKIRHDLVQLLKQEGFDCVEDAVGYRHEELYWKKQQERVKAIA